MGGGGFPGSIWTDFCRQKAAPETPGQKILRLRREFDVLNLIFGRFSDFSDLKNFHLKNIWNPKYESKKKGANEMLQKITPQK